jgi:hypothetical protein
MSGPIIMKAWRNSSGFGDRAPVAQCHDRSKRPATPFDGFRRQEDGPAKMLRVPLVEAAGIQLFTPAVQGPWKKYFT